VQCAPFQSSDFGWDCPKRCAPEALWMQHSRPRAVPEPERGEPASRRDACLAPARVTPSAREPVLGASPHRSRYEEMCSRSHSTQLCEVELNHKGPVEGLGGVSCSCSATGCWCCCV